MLGGVLVALVTLTAARGAAPRALTIGDGFVDPIGFHDCTPTFSWKLPIGTTRQSAYQLEVTVGAHTWDTGWVESDHTTMVPYGGSPLAARQSGQWRVRVRDEHGRESEWSDLARFELGLLGASDWQAHWIRPSQESDPAHEAVATLRRSFTVAKPVERARLYVTARGVFALQINGHRVGDDHFANGWTSYHHRLDTLTYDVTEQLQHGDNSVTARLGTGWFTGRLGWERNGRFYYGPDNELLLQLEIAYVDGTSATLVSDHTWEGTFEGPIVSSSFYDGEVYDARRTTGGWTPVTARAELGSARLTPKPFPPVRAEQTLAVHAITEPGPGRYVFDLGQNMVGWPRVRVPMLANTTLTMRFAEMLNTDGTLYTKNYRSAKATITYTAASNGEIEWQPHFTFQGFRYVELSGLPPDVEPQKQWLTGIVLYSALRPVGEFTSSHPKLNQLQSNLLWGLRGNFLDIPTDCPQRDERLGWTGDAQVFCATAMFNYDSHAFWKSWLETMRHDQMPDGRIPHVVPHVLPNILEGGGSPGWMDAATMIPWDVYVRTGDTEVLVENYAMMEKLVGWYRGKAVDHLIPTIPAFGDWLQPYSPANRGQTPAALIGTVFYAHSTQILANVARVLGRPADAEHYAGEARNVRQAFVRHYLDADGRLQHAPETQTGYVLALAFDLVPPELKPRLAAHLVRLVGEAGGHLRTGFLGTPHLVRVLDEAGHADLAYELLFKESYPSWFYSINQGATTMWERWNSYSHEHGFGDAGMNSFNHYAYGAIGQWLYERVAGLAPDPARPGYKHFFVRPLIGGPLESAHAALETPYGRAVSRWTKRDGRVEWEVVVPPNTTATIELQDGRPRQTVGPGTHRFTGSSAR